MRNNNVIINNRTFRTGSLEKDEISFLLNLDKSKSVELFNIADIARIDYISNNIYISETIRVTDISDYSSAIMGNTKTYNNILSGTQSVALCPNFITEKDVFWDINDSSKKECDNLLTAGYENYLIDLSVEQNNTDWYNRVHYLKKKNCKVGIRLTIDTTIQSIKKLVELFYCFQYLQLPVYNVCTFSSNENLHLSQKLVAVLRLICPTSIISFNNNSKSSRFKLGTNGIILTKRHDETTSDYSASTGIDYLSYDEQKQWYDTRYKDTSIPLTESVYGSPSDFFIDQFLKNCSNASDIILDIASGDGKLSIPMTNYAEWIIAIDKNRTANERHALRTQIYQSDNIEIICRDFFDYIESSTKFNKIVCANFIHDLPLKKVETLFDKVSNLITDNGLLYLSFESGMRLKDFDGNYFNLNRLFNYTPQFIEELLTNRGFGIIQKNRNEFDKEFSRETGVYRRTAVNNELVFAYGYGNIRR